MESYRVVLLENHHSPDFSAGPSFVIAGLQSAFMELVMIELAVSYIASIGFEVVD